jgi:cellobiose-specific phosphotransferase system component IIC
MIKRRIAAALAAFALLFALVLVVICYATDAAIQSDANLLSLSPGGPARVFVSFWAVLSFLILSLTSWILAPLSFSLATISLTLVWKASRPYITRSVDVAAMLIIVFTVLWEFGTHEYSHDGKVVITVSATDPVVTVPTFPPAKPVTAPSRRPTPKHRQSSWK